MNTLRLPPSIDHIATYSPQSWTAWCEGLRERWSWCKTVSGVCIWRLYVWSSVAWRCPGWEREWHVSKNESKGRWKYNILTCHCTRTPIDLILSRHLFQNSSSAGFRQMALNFDLIINLASRCGRYSGARWKRSTFWWLNRLVYNLVKQQSDRIGSRIQDKRKTKHTLGRTNSKIWMALSLGD